MNTLRCILPLAILLVAPQWCTACDFEVTLRPHSDWIVLGDPLYLEVTIVNRGCQTVSACPPELLFRTLVVRMYDHSTDMFVTNRRRSGLMGGVKPISFEPGKPIRYYCYLFLPSFHRFGHPFWENYQDGGVVYLRAVFRPWGWGSQSRRENTEVVSNQCDIRVQPRREGEIEALRRWNERVDPYCYEKGPTPASFGLPVRITNRKEMGEFAFHAALSGELGEMVELAILLRDIYDTPPHLRDESNRRLVQWLQKEPPMERSGSYYSLRTPEGGLERVRYYPEVKRQVLLRKLRSVVVMHNMMSTFDALGGGDREQPQLVPPGTIWSQHGPETTPDTPICIPPP